MESDRKTCCVYIIVYAYCRPAICSLIDVGFIKDITSFNPLLPLLVLHSKHRGGLYQLKVHKATVILLSGFCFPVSKITRPTQTQRSWQCWIGRSSDSAPSCETSSELGIRPHPPPLRPLRFHKPRRAGASSRQGSTRPTSVVIGVGHELERTLFLIELQETPLHA
jgi:hypothetical protein